VFSKGTPLPAQKTVKYRATRVLTPGKPDSNLVIKLWEGEFPDDPEANEWVGNVELSHDRVRRAVPEGAEIEVTIKVDASRLISVEAFVPHLNQHFSDRLYIPQREEQDFSNLSHQVAKDASAYRRRLDEIELTSSRHDDDGSARAEIDSLRQDLDAIDAKATHTSGTAGKANPDDARRIVGDARTVRGRLDRLERRAAGQAGAPDSTQLVALIEHADKIVEQYGAPLEKQQLAMLRRELERGVSKSDDKVIQRVCGEIDGLRWRVLFKHDWFWREIFDSLAEPNTPFANPTEAQRLISRGRIAISNGDGEDLRSTVRALWKLQPKGNADAIRERAAQSGLRRF
jgi:molecular chaperone DnaK